MSRCIDWPCCGHESGCCPDFDDNGNQLNMVCVCGAKLPVTSRYSICKSCMRDEELERRRDSDEFDDFVEVRDDYERDNGRDDMYDAWSREY